ncbi:hypothetical protein GP486_008651, partial [Trichoglossum hirsutum]
MEDVNPELESFREQWRREVTARSSKDRASTGATAGASSSAAPKLAAARASELPLAPAATSGRKDGDDDDNDNAEDVAPKTYHDLDDRDSTPGLGGSSAWGSSWSSARRGSTSAGSTLRSALEHYEKAVEKESQGSLGESLNLYRKAYR